jgi:hypothetical protein
MGPEIPEDMNLRLYPAHKDSADAQREAEDIIETFVSSFESWQHIYAKCGANDSETADAFMYETMKALGADLKEGNPPQNSASPVAFNFGPGEDLQVRPGRLESTLCTGHPEDAYNDHALHGFESVLLALASAGVDLSTPQMRAVVHTAYESICNQYQ